MLPVTPEPRQGTQAVVFAKNQPQYRSLPANMSEGRVETKWQLSWAERLHVLLRGTVYLTVANYGQPLQPVRMSILREE